MKTLCFLFFLLVLSLSAFANEKGNGLDPEQRQILALELILEHGLALQEKTYVTLSAKHLSRSSLALFARYPGTSDEKLQPHTQMSSQEVHPKMKPFTIVVSELIKLEQSELLRSVTVEDPNFYKAFDGLNSNDQELQLITSFWLMLKAKVIQVSGEKSWRSFTSTIDPVRLGYSLP